jgi:hypothetical protein
MKRPVGITVLAIVAFVMAAFFALSAFRAIVGGYIVATTLRSPLVPDAAASPVSYFGIMIAICAILFGIDGVGLWKLKEWGRQLTFGLVAISLIVDLVLTAAALINSQLLVMVFWTSFAGIDAFLLWYLSRPTVKSLFRRVTPAATAPIATL